MKRLFLIAAILLLSFSVVSAQDGGAGDTGSILVWTVDGAAGPGQQGASNPGQLALVGLDGNLSPIFDLPEGTSVVSTCGEAATSADGQYLALYVGIGDTGNIYLMDGQNAPVVIDDVLSTVCLGSGTFEFAPSGPRFGYIAYEPGSANDEFADGFLKIYEGTSELFSIESVTAFDLRASDAAFVSFFTNDRGEADEAAVFVWNGQVEREVATIIPDEEGCAFTSATVNYISDSQLALVMGHRCAGTGTSWQLYTVDIEGRSALKAATDSVPGRFASFARTNNIFPAADGSSILFSIPDGITGNTAGLSSVSLDSLEPSLLVERQVVFPSTTPQANALPRVSPNGRWLALVVTSPNADNLLNIIDLNDMSASPISYEAGSRGDTISALAFTPDSSRLLFVSGGDNTANNSLIAVDLAAGSDFRVRRGRFANSVAVSNDGSTAAIADWQILEDPNEPPFLNLFAVGIEDSVPTELFVGAVVEEGEVISQSFAYPLAWR